MCGVGVVGPPPPSCTHSLYTGALIRSFKSISRCVISEYCYWTAAEDCFVIAKLVLYPGEVTDFLSRNEVHFSVRFERLFRLVISCK